MSAPTIALIPAAGFGTRMFPVTKTISKEMLPVYNRPMVDYVVEACVRAGVTDIIFVVRADDQQLRDFYAPAPDKLVQFYSARGQAEKLEPILHIHEQAQFHFIDQPDDGRYGTAIPVQLAAEQLANQTFTVLNGDCLSWIPGGSELTLMSEAMEAAQVSSALAVQAINDEDVHRFGIIEYEDFGYKKMTRLKEKPTLEETDSRLGNQAHYIFAPQFLEYMNEVQADGASQEFYITDAIEAFAQDYPVLVHEAQGTYLNVGHPEAFVSSNQTVALQQPS